MELGLEGKTETKHSTTAQGGKQDYLLRPLTVGGSSLSQWHFPKIPGVGFFPLVPRAEVTVRMEGSVCRRTSASL